MIVYNKGEEKANYCVGKAPSTGLTNRSPHIPPFKREALRRPPVIHEEAGRPLIHNGSEDEQRSFDSTCRKLHRSLFTVSEPSKIGLWMMLRL
jgi:hypothetical protein